MYVHTLSNDKFPRSHVKIVVGSESATDVVELHKALYDVTDVQVSTIDVETETATMFEKLIDVPVPARHNLFKNFYAVRPDSVQNMVNSVSDIYKTLSDVETGSEDLSDMLQSINSDTEDDDGDEEKDQNAPTVPLYKDKPHVNVSWLCDKPVDISAGLWPIDDESSTDDNIKSTDTILLIGQTDVTENGIYLYSRLGGYKSLLSVPQPLDTSFPTDPVVFVRFGEHADSMWTVVDDEWRNVTEPFLEECKTADAQEKDNVSKLQHEWDQYRYKQCTGCDFQPGIDGPCGMFETTPFVNTTSCARWSETNDPNDTDRPDDPSSLYAEYKEPRPEPRIIVPEPHKSSPNVRLVFNRVTDNAVVLFDADHPGLQLESVLERHFPECNVEYVGQVPELPVVKQMIFAKLGQDVNVKNLEKAVRATVEFFKDDKDEPEVFAHKIPKRFAVVGFN